MKLFLTLLIVLFSTSFVFSETVQNEKVKLIFSIDQIFSNGLINNDDTVALKNIINTVKPLNEYYDVYLLLNPMIKDKNKLYNALDIMKENNQCFVFDALTSDVQALSYHMPDLIEPYDDLHGKTMSTNEMEIIKKKYGKYFAGIRFMETYGVDYMDRMVKLDTENGSWKIGFSHYKFPEDDYFQQSIVEEYLKFVKDNNMFAQWTDFTWSEFSAMDEIQHEIQIEREKSLADAAKNYPNTLYICYSNNENDELAVENVAIFDEALKIATSKGGYKGIGLSNQAWLRFDVMNTDPYEMINWSKSALDKGCTLIQFEPYCYYFNFPFGKIDNYITDYRTEENYSEGKAGIGTDKYKVMEKFLIDYAKSSHYLDIYAPMNIGAINSNKLSFQVSIRNISNENISINISTEGIKNEKISDSNIIISKGKSKTITISGNYDKDVITVIYSGNFGIEKSQINVNYINLTDKIDENYNFYKKLEAESLKGNIGQVANDSDASGQKIRKITDGENKSDALLFGPYGKIDKGDYIAVFKLKRIDNNGELDAYANIWNHMKPIDTTSTKLTNEILPLNEFVYLPIKFSAIRGDYQTCIIWNKGPAIAVDCVYLFKKQVD